MNAPDGSDDGTASTSSSVADAFLQQFQVKDISQPTPQQELAVADFVVKNVAMLSEGQGRSVRQKLRQSLKQESPSALLPRPWHASAMTGPNHAGK